MQPLGIVAAAGMALCEPAVGPRQESSDALQREVVELQEAVSAEPVDAYYECWPDWAVQLEEILQAAQVRSEPATKIGRQAYGLLRQLDRDLVRSGELNDEEELEFQNLARRAAELAGDPEWVLYRCFRLAKIQQENGEVEQATELLSQAVEPLPSAPNTLALALFSLADLQVQRGEFREALQRLTECEEYLQQGTGPRVAWSVPSLYARIFLQKGLPDHARPHVDRALRHAEVLRQQGLDASTVVVHAYLRNVEHARAVDQHRRVLELVDHYLGDAELFARESRAAWTLRRLRADSAANLGDEEPSLLDEAALDLREIVASEDLYFADRWSSQVLLADVELRRGHLDEAQRLARELQESLPAAAEQLELQLQLQSFSARLQLATDAPRDALLLGAEGLEQALGRMLQSWREAQLSAAGAGFLLFQSRVSLLSQLLRVHKKLSGEAGLWRIVDHYLAIDQHSSLFRRLGCPIPDQPRQTLQSMLGPDRGILLFPSGEWQTHVLALDAEGIEHAELSSHDLLRAKVQRYRQCLFRPPSAAAELDARIAAERDLAKQLADELLPPVIRAKLQRWNHVQVVATGFFAAIPVAWLILDDGQRLGASQSVSHWPSLLLGAHLSARARQLRSSAGQLDYLLLAGSKVTAAVSALAPQLDELTIRAPDRDSLLRAFAARPHRVLLNAEANLDSLQQASAFRVRVLQLLCHSVFDGHRDIPLGLVLSPAEDHAGILWAEDLEALPTTQLAVLTACRSATGRERRGDRHAADLAGACLARGIPAVLATEADLRVDVALTLTELFHASLLEGHAPAEALRRVQVDFLAREGDLAPFQLGMVRLIGAGLEPIFETGDAASSRSRSLPWRAVLLVSLAIVLVGSLTYRLLRQRVSLR